MVLETLVSTAVAKREGWKIFLLGCLYATVGLFLAYWVFRPQSSMVMVFFTVLAAAHIMHALIETEEDVDEKEDTRTIFIEHSRTLSAFLYLFLGFTVAFTFWNIALDSAPLNALMGSGASHTLFAVQNDTVAQITGGAIHAAAVDTMARFNVIFMNNLIVLAFALLFSFVYGYGAIFILVWNASVIAAAAGASYRVAVAGVDGFANMVLAFINSLAQYALHGIPEILAYFVAALAAGVLGVAIARKRWREPEKFRKVLFDFVELTLISVILLFVAAILEVWVTPLIISL